MKQQTRSPARAGKEMASIYAFSRRLAAASSSADIYLAIEEHLANLVQRKVVLFGAVADSDRDVKPEQEGLSQRVHSAIADVRAGRTLATTVDDGAGVGSLHRLRDAVENGWPQPLEIEEHSHAAMANAYEAGAADLPFAVFRGYIGTDLPKVNPSIKRHPAPIPARCWRPCRRTGRMSRSFMRSRPTATAMCCSKASSACRRKRCSPAKRSHRHGRGDRRRFRPAQPQRRDPAGLDGERDRRRAGRRVIRPTRTATTSATTPSTRPGTRSRATATPSSPG